MSEKPAHEQTWPLIRSLRQRGRAHGRADFTAFGLGAWRPAPFAFQFPPKMITSFQLGRWSVKAITELAANKLGKFLAKDFRRVFGPAHDDMAERLGSLARSTIECLARSDALYHNFEHTLQVTMVGRDILEGMTLSQRIEPTDYSHLIVACLLHDIGYMRFDLTGTTETE